MASFSHGNLTTLVWFHLGAYRGVLLQWISCLYNGLTFDTYIAMCSVEQGIFNAFENVVRPCWRLVPYIFNDNAHTHIETWSFGKIGAALSLSLCFFFKYLMIAEKMFLARTISRNTHTSNINKKYRFRSRKVGRKVNRERDRRISDTLLFEPSKFWLFVTHYTTFLNGPYLASFYSIFVLSVQLIVNKCCLKIRHWLDSNNGPLV